MTKSKITGYKLLFAKTAYILFYIKNSLYIVLVGSVNYTINTLDQIKPILVGFRKSNGLSQKALAEKLGISQQSYQTLESAPQKVTIERLFKVLSILDIKLQFVEKNQPLENSLSSNGLSLDEW